MLEHHDELAAVSAHGIGSVQTRSGRISIPRVRLAAVQRRFGRQVAVIEIRTSAGLNLLADRSGTAMPAVDDPAADRFATPVTLGPPMPACN